MDVKLVMFKANGQRREYAVGGEAVKIGRGTDCDLQIPLATVSRQHCEVAVAEGKVTVKDLGSSNGTFVNDQRVQEAELNAGDTLVIGPVIFTVMVDGQPEHIKPVRTVIVEQTVEPVTAQDELGDGTMDEEAAKEGDPLAALAEMAKKKK